MTVEGGAVRAGLLGLAARATNGPLAQMNGENTGGRLGPSPRGGGGAGVGLQAD
jgi:hypothetical protein